MAAGTALQRPSYSVQEEGVVVVTIFVNPSGKVEDAFIGPGTTTGNKTLRESARKAALATRFNAVEGQNNQKGTITYRFQLN
ncbi:energy transducer TonB [uncultured Porphyromonas sp.]|uniref:energy transducer TonB family protein n=1 Tax=uncultured Porphyromonas sp. TaxID=159274 RepID=UPI00262B35A6|nr:energy transducer TonB [uncultured Porphyromonas sp.]